MGTRSKYYNILNSTKNEHLEKKKTWSLFPKELFLTYMILTLWKIQCLSDSLFPELLFSKLNTEKNKRAGQPDEAFLLFWGKGIR